MPGLNLFLPALKMPAYVCRNCGFWQRFFEQPSGCPLCFDARHVVPSKGWSFYDIEAARREFPMYWEEVLPGLWKFWNDPVDGIGSQSYFLQNDHGNMIFEGATVYSEAALDLISSLGGIQLASASHPHTYGALWQLQDHFDTNIALHPADFSWSGALCVTHPFDDEFEIFPGITLLHAGVHFAGQTFLYDRARKVLFCGDALKFDLDSVDPRRAKGISAHKAFVRGVPLTPQESVRYQEVFSRCHFEKTYSPFEQVHNVGSNTVNRFFEQLRKNFPQPEFVSLFSLNADDSQT